MLEQEELRRRIRAARELAGISQTDMNTAGHDLGLRKHTLGRVERGDQPVEHVHLAMLCEILDVPMSWFTQNRVTQTNRADDSERLRRIEEKLDKLLRTTTPEREPRTKPEEDDADLADELDELGRDDEDVEPPAQAGGQG